MKVKVIRTSGNPVSTEEAANYQEEWRKEFDKIWNDDTKPAEERSKLIDELEVRLKEKYDDLTVVTWDLPNSGKKWTEVLSEYGNVLVTTNAATGELLLVVHDMPF